MKTNVFSLTPALRLKIGAFALAMLGTLAQSQPAIPQANQLGGFPPTTAPTTQSGGTQPLSFGRNLVPPYFTNAPELNAIVGDRDQMEQFVVVNPDSPYTPWLRNTLAANYRHAGRITPALNHWQTVWEQLKSENDSTSYEEANHALAGQLELLTTLGRAESLYGLLKAAEGRTITDPEDRERIAKAREGYVMMVKNPALNYRCGTVALAEIARTQGKPASTIAALIEEPSPKEGISLLRLVQLCRQYGLGMVAVKRTDSTPLPVPSIVHWAQNHYGALMEFRADLGAYRVIFGDPQWMTASDVDAEASGYFLIPANQRPSNWPLVSDTECATVLGRSYIYSIKDSQDKGCKVDPTNPKAKCPACDGMPVWWVTEPYINVFLADEPVSYTTSRSTMDFRVTVKQRDSTGNLFAYPRPGFLHNWYSRIFIQGMPVTALQYATNVNTGLITTNHVPVLETNAFANWTATVDLGSGGQVSYFSGTNANALYDEETKTRLQPSYGIPGDGTQYPMPGYPVGGTLSAPDAPSFSPGASSEEDYNYWNDGASGFRIFHSDGSVDRYGITYWRSNGLSGYYEEEALLTQRTDPLGNSVNLIYQLYTNSTIGVCLRLSQVVDYDNKTNTFVYVSNTSGTIQQIISPYNQTASFAYNSTGNLTNITDAVSNSSGLTWDSNGRVSTLTTPYGTTGFNYFDADLPGTNDSTLNGDIPVDRSVTVGDPAGGTNIYAYCFDSQSGAGTPSQFPSNSIPQNTPLGTLDTGTNNVVGHDYSAAYFRNSFHWNALQTASLSTISAASMTTTDFAKARMQHWLGDSNNVFQTSLISVEQDPSPDGTTPGQLTFYDYYGKTLKFLQGTNSQIAVVARVQPSGTTDYDWKQHNFDGFVTEDISTYTLADNIVRTRTNTFIYAPNIISYVLSNSIVGITSPALYALNSGGSFINSSEIQQPTTPLFAVYETISNTCGVWSTTTNSTAAVSLANLLVESIDSSGATNLYAYAQTSKIIPATSYTAWYNYYTCYCGNYLTTSAPWQQYIINSYTVPIPVKITNAVGYVQSLTLDANNRVTSIHSFSGLTTTNIYGTNGFLSQAVDLEIGRTNSYTYSNGLVKTATNERGLITTYAWDNLQRMVSKADTEGVISNVYTRLDLTATEDKTGHWSYFAYDPLQHMVAITNANNEVKLASYCACGALEWTRDAITNYTQYGYDLAGRLLNAQHPDGYTVTNYYNSLNQLTKTGDPLGYVTNSYNLQGLLTISANNLGVIQSNSFDILDRKVAVTDDRGITSVSSFDIISRVLTNIISGKITNSFAYSNIGLVKSTDGLLTNVTSYYPDPLGHVLIRTNANGEITQFHYDSSGNITNILDGKSQNTWFQFDAFNRLTNKLDNTQTSILKLAYDVNSQLYTRWTLEKGTTTYIRDLAGRVRTNSYPHNPTVVFTYDPNGRVITMNDGIGTTTYTYTPTGEQQSEGGLWANDIVTIAYNYQLRNSLSLGSLNTTYYYDAAHRLYRIIAGSGTYTYAYQSGFGGNYSSPLVQSLSLPNSMSVTNGYDSVGRLNATVLLNSAQGIFDSQQYLYDADNRRISETRYDGSSIGYTYDRIGQLKTGTAKESNGTTVRLNEQFGYAYDKAGNLNSRTNNTLTLAFGINTVNELTNSTRTGSLTAAGNTSQSATSVSVNGQGSSLYGDKTFATTAGLPLNNGANTFTTVVQYASTILTNIATTQLPAPVVYLNDSNGNLTNDGLRSFSYDDENELLGVTIPGQTQSLFIYDGMGRRRIARDYSWNGRWVLTNEVHFIYDGKLVIQERDGLNNIQVSYDRGLDLSGSLQGAGGIGGLLARTDIKGTVYYHSDGSGNVVTLVDRYQTLEGRYLYDPYGNTVGIWGPYANVNRYRYASREYLPLSGLYYFGARYYDPNLQRFLNRDPLGEAGGFNLYGYVGNNPINVLDPLGFCPWSWNNFGNWELGVLTDARQFFTGAPGDVQLDPNSLLYLSNQAGVGNTPLTDAEGNIVSATDLAFDIFTQPLVALGLGGAGDIADFALSGEAVANGGKLAAAADIAESSVPTALREGQLAEGPALDALGSLGKVTFTPTADQINSAAFNVIVGDAKYTKSGAPVSTIFDGSTSTGLMEIKSGSSVLNSTYQLRLQTYAALVNNQPLTIYTSRAVNTQFSAWLGRWGVSVKPLP
jgi:RHS repeat-associated protein